MTATAQRKDVFLQNEKEDPCASREDEDMAQATAVADISPIAAAKHLGGPFNCHKRRP